MTQNQDSVTDAVQANAANEGSRSIRNDDDRRFRRTRNILVAILVLLMLMLIAVGGLVYRLVLPVGGPKSAKTASGFEWVRSIYGYGEAADQQFENPTDVAIGPDGRIWGTDPKHFRVLGFNPDGSFSTLIHQGPGGTGTGQIYSAEGAAVGDNGDIYVADFGNNKIIEFTPDNKFVREWPFPGATEVAQGGGRIVAGSVYGVGIFDLQGNLIKTIGTRGKGQDQFDIVHGVVVAPDGSFFVSDTQNHRVKAFTRDGELKWISGHTSAELKAAEATGTATEVADLNKQPEFQIPSGMTLDGAGRLVVVDPFEFQIVVMNAETGDEIARYGEYGEEDGKFSYPTGISYDKLHDWFAVADTQNSRLEIVRIPGSGGGAAASARRILTQPWWMCAVPLGLLALALIVSAVMRRRRREVPAEEAAVNLG